VEGAVFHVDMCVWPLIAVEQEVRCGSERKLGPPREPSHFRGETRPLTTLEIMLRRHFGVCALVGKDLEFGGICQDLRIKKIQDTKFQDTNAGFGL